MKCIEHYSSACQACGTDFTKLCGEKFTSSIHAHHITPMHKQNEEYDIDPQ